jgi:putative acetyltransferase
MNPNWRLRPASNFDSAEIACLIDRVFREYGDRVAPRRGERDLLNIEQSYWGAGGAFVVLEESHDWVNAGEVIGTAAMLAAEMPHVCVLRRFYVDSRHRGQAAALHLARWAAAWAQLRGFRRMEFGSDTRFERGHAFFEKIGLKKTDLVRDVSEGVLPYSERFIEGEVPVLRDRVDALHRYRYGRYRRCHCV